MAKTITVTVPEYVRDEVQRYDVERSARRDIIAYILSNDTINIPPERMAEYQKEYDEKFMLFEKAKSKIESEYVKPNAGEKALNWTLDYNTCIVTITVNE